MRDDPTIGMNATAYVLLDCVDAPLIVVDTGGGVQHVSPGFERAFGVVAKGMKYQEIAEALEIPLGTVKSRMHAAVMKLKDLLAGKTGELE